MFFYKINRFQKNIYHFVRGTVLGSKNEDSATVKVVRAMLEGQFTPLFHKDILIEYEEVLHRERFPFTDEVIDLVIGAVQKYGIIGLNVLYLRSSRIV